MTRKFRKIAKFKYKNKKFQLFMDEKNRLAFLEIDEFEKYHYPNLENLLELVQIFATSQNILNIKDDRIKYFNFSPKVLHKGLPFLLSLSLLTGCSPRLSNNHTFHYNPSTSFKETTETQENVQEEEGTKENESINEDEILDKYLELLALADDDYDYKYASDYENFEMIKRVAMRDSSAYDEILGYSNISVEQIEKALKDNRNISQDYKEFILQYVKDWNTLFPGSDFSVLYTNIKNGLNIKKITKNEMMWTAGSPDSQACWKAEENTIYVLNDINLDKSGDGYIIFTHELTHAARGAKFKNKDGITICISFFDDIHMGYYAEEALIMCFVYMLQDMGNKSHFYTLQTSYYRVILDAIDYDGADFLNHSVNYLIEKMDEYMEDTQYAYHIVSLIDAEASLRYTKHIQVDFHEFSELYAYITRMYTKKYLTADMTYEEAEVVYQNLMNEITYYFDQMNNPYEIDYDIFGTTFNECVEELGINKEAILGVR